MSSYHKEKALELIRHLASEFIIREFNFPKVNPAMVTVTKVDSQNKLQSANIFVTIFPEDYEKEIIQALNKQNREMREYFKKHARMRELPSFAFDLDKEQKIQRKIEEEVKNNFE